MDARFDALAIGLAGAVSRREALRWLGAFVAGTLLGDRLAWAQGKDECFDFCDEVIGRKDVRSRISCRLNCQKCKRNNGTVCLGRIPRKGFETPSVCAPPGLLIRCPTDGRCCRAEDECCGSPSVCCDANQVCNTDRCVPCPGGGVACRGQYDGFDPFSQCCAPGEACDENQRCFRCPGAGVACRGQYDGSNPFSQCCAPFEACDENQRCVPCPTERRCGARCCAPGEVCDQGQCAAPLVCEPGRTLCGGDVPTYAQCCPPAGTILTKCCPANSVFFQPAYCAPPDPYVCCQAPLYRCDAFGFACCSRFDDDHRESPAVITLSPEASVTKTTGS